MIDGNQDLYCTFSRDSGRYPNSQLADTVARDFSGAFYQVLAYGRPIQQAFEQGLVRLRMDRVDPATFPGLFVRNNLNSYSDPVSQATAPPQHLTSLAKAPGPPEGTLEQPIIIEIRISENIENFNAERSAALLQVIGAALKWNGEVKIVGVRPGSTIVSLQLPYDKAQQLLELIQQGELQPYGILEASLHIPSASTPSTDTETHPEPLPLTPREQEIVRLVTQRTSNPTLATQVPETYPDSLHDFNELFQQRFNAESEIGQSKNPDQEAPVQSSQRHNPQQTQISRSLGPYETERDLLTALQAGNETAWLLFLNWSVPAHR